MYLSARSVAGLFLLASAGCLPNGAFCVYERDDQSGYLRIDRIPPSATIYNWHEMKTQLGTRDVREACGDCEAVFWGILWLDTDPGAARLIVETKDQAYYRVMFDCEGRFNEVAMSGMPVGQLQADYGGRPYAAAEEIADKLGLEIVRVRRRRPVFVIRPNDEKPTGIELFHGISKWPNLRLPSERGNDKSGPLLMSCEMRKFPHGGIYLSKSDDDTLYFDGVSFDELAQYFEAKIGRPVVNQAGDNAIYCFTLPNDFWKEFSFGNTVPLPGLGMSIMSDELEIECTVVRDKRIE